MITQDERIRTEVLRAASNLEEYSVTCQVSRGDVILEGPVSSDEHSYQLEDAVRALPAVKSVNNSLTVEGFVASIDNEIEGVDLTPDFAAKIGTDDPLEADSEAETYFPPTDPVIGTSGPAADDVEILNGFGSATGDDGSAAEPGAPPRGDEELHDLVEEALKLDAGTADLEIEVRVRNGIVTLRGEVPSLDDAELAENVAASVPGVEEVREELRIEGM